jgi:hypothetical protein
MSGQSAVFGSRSPPVWIDPDAGLARIDHGFNRQHQARLQSRTLAGISEIRHLRILVQRCPDSVSHELSHHGKSESLDMFLHGVPDIRDPVSRSHLLQSQL